MVHSMVIVHRLPTLSKRIKRLLVDNFLVAICKLGCQIDSSRSTVVGQRLTRQRLTHFVKVLRGSKVFLIQAAPKIDAFFKFSAQVKCVNLWPTTVCVFRNQMHFWYRFQKCYFSKGLFPFWWKTQFLSFNQMSKVCEDIWLTNFGAKWSKALRSNLEHWRLKR